MFIRMTILVVIFFITLFLENDLSSLQTAFATLTNTGGQEKQNVQNWKTYFNPSMGFSVNYPTYNGIANITEKPNGLVKSVIISIPLFDMVFHIVNDALLDPQKQAIQSRIQDQKDQNTVSEITPIVVNGVIGYRYFTMNSDTLFTTTNMFFKNPLNYYDIFVWIK